MVAVRVVHAGHQWSRQPGGYPSSLWPYCRYNPYRVEPIGYLASPICVILLSPVTWQPLLLPGPFSCFNGLVASTTPLSEEVKEGKEGEEGQEGKEGKGAPLSPLRLSSLAPSLVADTPPPLGPSTASPTAATPSPSTAFSVAPAGLAASSSSNFPAVGGI